MHRLATHPAELMRFQATGRLPSSVPPSSPLIELLRKIGPSDLTRLLGVTVDDRLGYTGSRQFQTAMQALNWVAPPGEHFDTHWPAESWRDKRFSRALTLEEFLGCCERVPDDFRRRHGSPPEAAGLGSGAA